MAVNWRRLGIIFAITFAGILATGYAVYGNWQFATSEACQTAPFWTVLVYWATGAFLREWNRPKWHAVRKQSDPKA